MVFILDERARGAMVRCRDTQSTRAREGEGEGEGRGERRTQWISCLKATNRNRNRNRTQEKNRGQGGRLGIPVRGGVWVCLGNPRSLSLSRGFGELL